MNNKIYKKLFVGFGFVIIVLILTLFVMSQTYIQNLVYHERLSQMEEVTHQMFHSLEDVIDNHWDEVNVQCNYLYNTPLETDTDLYRYLKKLSELSNYHEKQVELIAVDAAGHYYTAHGRTGLLREMNYLESAPQRVSYVSNALTEDDSRMVFLKQLPTPITLQSETGEITLRYFGISQCMTQLNDFFRCDAYENNNSVYVLDNNGFKLFNANDTELLKGHNVYTVLSQMSYLHGSSFAAAKERLARTGSCYSNAVLDGTEYYYALKQMENAQWTLAFLVPAEYVAVNTQKLVNIVMVIIVGFATVFSITAVIAGWFLLREKQQRELQAEKETSLRLEQYNIQLTQANDEMRRAQDAAAEALQSAERASKAKTDFLSNMSHDIRTPINGIRGMIEIANYYKDDPDKQTECRKKIWDASGLLLELVNEVLDMGKLESGEIMLEEREFDLKELLDSVGVVVDKQARERGITIITDGYPVEHRCLLGSPLHLRRLLMNIISNAVKYNRVGGEIRLGCCEKPSADPETAQIEFTCADTGIGMSDEFQKHVFEPFAQERNTARSEYGGTGLGMPIAKSLAEKMGGTLSFVSRQGVGTTFTLSLPFRICHAPEKRNKPKRLLQTSSIAGLHVLVAEDNRMNMEIAEFVLNVEEAFIIKAVNGEEAVRIFADSRPGEIDAILMDVMMPVMDGLEATRRIRAMKRPDARTIPIIAMTANAFAEDRQLAFAAGMDMHIAKPLEGSEMVETLERLVKSSRK